ncbi:hypothetical protein KO499_02940 [Marinobacter sp. F3R08]|nr:hypothetical protein [Marinobacter sp. F3R08]
MRIKILFLVVTVVFLSACATTAKYEEILKTWVGSDINHLVASWGYPQNSFEAPNGNTVYMYSSSGSYTMPTQTTTTYNAIGNTVYGNSTTTGGQTLNFSCRTYFEVNDSDRIVSWRWQGNNCTAR